VRQQTSAVASPPGHEAESHGTSRLGSFLCWAVVFADIGTSVYYVPGILFGSYGALAGFFVILTLVVFVLLVLKYVEVSARFPEGGGVVTVSSRAIGPWAGALGGMLILVDYFLTASLSSFSGLTYFEVIWPGIGPWVLGATVAVLIILGLLNWYGIRESAAVSAVVAMIALATDLLVLLFVFIKVPLGVIADTFVEMFSGHHLTPVLLVTGYAGAFLAFSGLESISQLSPVMRVPRKRVAGWAMGLVIVTVGITSPLLTVFSTTLLCPTSVVAHGVRSCVSPTGHAVDPNQFISALGGHFAGAWLGALVAISASSLLVFASNTAIIGSYHVFLALTRMRFFPPVVGHYNRLRDTPHVAILLATGIPIAILVGAGVFAGGGVISLLGDMYAFGLLGAFTLTCIGLDIVRWRERRHGGHVGPTAAEEAAEEAAQARTDEQALQRMSPRRRALHESQQLVSGQLARAAGLIRAQWQSRVPEATRASLRRIRSDVVFGLGILTTFFVVVGWGTNIINKPLATEFGGAVTAIGLAVAWFNHRRQERAGLPAVHPVYVLQPIPHSMLVVLPVGSSETARLARQAVVREAAQHAEHHTLVLLYLAPSAVTGIPRLMEITDPFARDVDAQLAMSEAENIIRRIGGTQQVSASASGIARLKARVQELLGQRSLPRVYTYRTGKVDDLQQVWGLVRPEVTVGQANQNLARVVQAAYVRYYVDEGVRVAFYVSHTPVGDGQPLRTPTGGPLPSRQDDSTRSIPEPSSEAPAAPKDSQQRAESSPEETPGPPRSRVVPRPEEEGLEDADEYVWTGTDLKRRDEMPEDDQAEQKQGR
jgi:amino acid transporter